MISPSGKFTKLLSIFCFLERACQNFWVPSMTLERKVSLRTPSQACFSRPFFCYCYSNGNHTIPLTCFFETKHSGRFFLRSQNRSNLIVLWWLRGEESAYQCRRHGFNPWVRKIPRGSKWQPTPVFLPRKCHGQRSLAGYSPWGSQKSQTWFSN